MPNRNSGVSSHCFLGTTSSAQASRGCNAFVHRPVLTGLGLSTRNRQKALATLHADTVWGQSIWVNRPAKAIIGVM